MSLKRTPLYGEHLRLGARMGPFGGWEMPISYRGILDEHRHCRSAAAVFDICHMGEFLFRGDFAATGMEAAVTQPLGKMKPGACKYGFILNEEGGILDDLIVLKQDPERLLLVVNAAPAAGDFSCLRGRLQGGELRDASAETAKIDLQGPLSREVLEALLGTALDLGYFRFGEYGLLGEKVLIARAGYTGELGYEIYSRPEAAPVIWRRLLEDSRVLPAGLGARDILRLEIGYSLYGSDIDETTTPLEADLGAFLNFEKDFIGKQALLRQMREGTRKRKIAFAADSRRSPRHGYRIAVSGEEAGTVTSGCFSPMLSRGIGLGYVAAARAREGARIEVGDRKSVNLAAEIVKLPFYREGSLRN